MRESSLDRLPLDSATASTGYARRLAFEPEEHSDFIFSIVGPDGQDITGGVLSALALLIASAVVGVWLWRRRHRDANP
jgi:cell division protein FtsW (lipid II flippase)